MRFCMCTRCIRARGCAATICAVGTIVCHWFKFRNAVLVGPQYFLILGRIHVPQSDGPGATALMLTAIRGAPGPARALIRAGAALNAQLNVRVSRARARFFGAGRGRGTTASTQSRLRVQVEWDFFLVAEKGATALMCAARGGHTELVQVLVDAGADTRLTDVVRGPRPRTDSVRIHAIFEVF